MMKYCVLKSRVIVCTGEAGCIWVAIDVQGAEKASKSVFGHLNKG